MTLAHTVAGILQKHVTLTVEGMDRLYLNVYVPQLQTDRGVVGFFRFHRGHPFASSALMAPMTAAFVEEIERFAEHQKVPLLTLERGQRKDDIAAKFLS